MQVKPGDILHGFCNGFFGRDSYGCKVVIAVGDFWIVAAEEGGSAEFCLFPSEWRGAADELLENWKQPWEMCQHFPGGPTYWTSD